MQTVFVLVEDQLCTRAHPDPFAIGAADAEGMVDRAFLMVGQTLGQHIEVFIIGMDQVVDFTEGQKFANSAIAKHLVHRIRPIKRAARDIPIPQATASARQSGINPLAHLLDSIIGFFDTP